MADPREEARVARRAIKQEYRTKAARNKRWNKRLDTVRDVVQDTLFGGVPIYEKTRRPNTMPSAEYRRRKNKNR